MKDNKIQYQMTVVLNPKIEEKDRSATFEKIGAQLEDLGGKTAKSEKLGVKDLSYPIKGNRKGEFWILDIESSKPMNYSKLEVMFNRDAHIIRYLILKI